MQTEFDISKEKRNIEKNIEKENIGEKERKSIDVGWANEGKGCGGYFFFFDLEQKNKFKFSVKKVTFK